MVKYPNIYESAKKVPHDELMFRLLGKYNYKKYEQLQRIAQEIEDDNLHYPYIPRWVYSGAGPYLLMLGVPLFSGKYQVLVGYNALDSLWYADVSLKNSPIVFNAAPKSDLGPIVRIQIPWTDEDLSGQLRNLLLSIFSDEHLITNAIAAPGCGTVNLYHVDHGRGAVGLLLDEEFEDEYTENETDEYEEEEDLGELSEGQESQEDPRTPETP